MTENEVIKELQSQINICESMIFYNCDFEPKNDNTNLYKKIETAREAIKALEEVQEYRKLGTVEKVREAVEKKKKCEKGIIVIDKPDACLDCRFCREIDEGIEACCTLTMDEQDKERFKQIDVDYCQEVPDWCPIKPLPEKE